MAVWMVRAGRGGEWEDWSLEANLVALRFDVAEDLRGKSWDDLSDIVRNARPEADPRAVGQFTGQLYRLVGDDADNGIAIGDLVVLPLQSRYAVALGEVKGGYAYMPESPIGPCHTRSIKWIRTDIPREYIPSDIGDALRAMMSLCAIKPESAAERLRTLAEGQLPSEDQPQGHSELEVTTDPARVADEQIREHIKSRFKKHELERLVEAILEAQGYATLRSQPGPDGGVDVLAAKGALGFDTPRIVVQVKSGNDQVRRDVIDSLLGNIGKFGGDQGLVVSLNGFTSDASREGRQNYFKVRLWDFDDIISALQDNYAQLPADIKGKIPLKQIWTLAQDEPA